MYKLFLGLFMVGLISTSYAVNVESPVTCELCSLVLGIAQNMLENNYTDTEILKFIDEQFCDRLGSLKDTCTTYVDTDGPQILYELSKDLDPTIICKRIGVCATRKNVVPVAALESNLTCSLCQIAVNISRSLLDNNHTEDEILEFMEKNVCPLVKAINASCVQYVQTHGKQILDMIIAKYDTISICKEVKLCAAVSQISRVEETPNSLNCTLCKVVFAQIQKVLTSNATQEKIIETLKRDLCKKNDTVTQVCDALLSEFGPAILQYVASKVQPEEACKFIGMCTANKKKVVVVPSFDLKANPVECVLCEFVVHELDSYLVNNKSEAAIVSALEKVCTVVPKSFKAQCTSLIQTYGQYLVELIIKTGADPKKICQAVSLC